MRTRAWVSTLGPPVLLLVLAAAGAMFLPAPLARANVHGVRGTCPAATDFADAMAASTRSAPIDARLKLVATLGARGELVGRVLTINSGAGPKTVSLAAESFATAPVTNVVVFGEATANGSTVSAIDLQTGCRYTVFKTGDVVRSAVIDPQLSVLYIHTVSSSDRADRGVARVDLATGAKIALLEPIASSATFGPTFATLLRWSVDDDALAVQSCGVGACRTRVISFQTRAVETYADPPHGQIVGLSRASVVTFDTCPGLPCTLVSIDRPDGHRSAIDVEALAATVGEDSGGAYIEATTNAGIERVRP